MHLWTTDISSVELLKSMKERNVLAEPKRLEVSHKSDGEWDEYRPLCSALKLCSVSPEESLFLHI